MLLGLFGVVTQCKRTAHSTLPGNLLRTKLQNINSYSASVNHSFSCPWVNNSVEAYQFRESNFMATIGLIGGDYRAVRLLLVTTPRAARGEHQARRKIRVCLKNAV